MTVQMLPYRGGERLSVRYRIAGAVGLACAVVAMRAPLPLRLATCRGARRLCPHRPSPVTAERLIQGVRAASRFWSGRTACLETALAGFFAGVILGAAPDFCIGARFFPFRARAWLEVDGHPIGQVDASDHWAFQALVRI